uniref:Uncharacterized protein n=1 Tax=Anguilla anguilla TaxID=7936 RepID=A0A0E9VGR1_ANGAN
MVQFPNGYYYYMACLFTRQTTPLYKTDSNTFYNL